MATILIVDDDAALREGLAETLADLGHRSAEAEDGAAALRHLGRGRVDAVLLDLRMPGMDGLEVLGRERPDVIVTDINMPRMDGFGFIEAVRQDASRRATPILVLTTESDAAKKQRAREAGATGWIVKPFDPAKLVDAVRRVAA